MQATLVMSCKIPHYVLNVHQIHTNTTLVTQNVCNVRYFRLQSDCLLLPNLRFAFAMPDFTGDFLQAIQQQMTRIFHVQDALRIRLHLSIVLMHHPVNVCQDIKQYIKTTHYSTVNYVQSTLTRV